MVAGDHRERGPVVLHPDRVHSRDDMRADRIRRQRLLVLVAARERLDLVLNLAVDADQLLGLCVIRLEIFVRKRPVPRLAANVAVGVADERRARSGIPLREPQVARREAQRHPAVELRPAPHHLRRVALDGGVVPIVSLVHVRLVVKVGLDMARIVRPAFVPHTVEPQDLLAAGRNQLVALERAQAVGRLVLRRKQRPLLEDKDGLSLFGELRGDRRSAGAAPDHNEIVLVLHGHPLFGSAQPSAEVVGAVAERPLDCSLPVEADLPVRALIGPFKVGPPGAPRVSAVLRVRERPCESVAAQQLQEEVRVFVFGGIPVLDDVAPHLLIEIFVVLLGHVLGRHPREALAEHAGDLPQAELVLDQAVTLLARDDVVDEVDRADRLLEAVSLPVDGPPGFPVGVEVEEVQEIARVRAVERQDLVGEPHQDGELPALETDRRRAVVREEARPLNPIVELLPLRVDRVEHRLPVAQEFVGVHLPLGHEHGHGPPRGGFAVEHHDIERGRAPQIVEGADHRHGRLVGGRVGAPHEGHAVQIGLARGAGCRAVRADHREPPRFAVLGDGCVGTARQILSNGVQDTEVIQQLSVHLHAPNAEI